MTPLLSAAQVAVLRELAGNNQAVLTPDHVKRTVFWRVWFMSLHIGYNRTPTVKALLTRGLLESPSGITANITPEGRAALAAIDAAKERE